MKKESQPYNQLSDGSLDFGNGVIGPSLLDQGHFNSITGTSKTNPIIQKLSPSPESRKFLHSAGRKALGLLPPSLTIPVILAACSGGSAVEKNNNQELKDRESSGHSLPFPEGETWFLTNGPHADGWSNGIKYAIDIAPPELGRLNGSCPTDGSRLSIDNRVVTASASGRVIAKGDDKNRTDPFHSQIRIEDKKGLTQVYIHLDKTKVKLGDKVKQGNPLGNPSCEYPPGGRNTGPHVHVGLMKNGQPIPIDGVVIGGWTIHEGVHGKDGTMTKDGEKTRTANAGRYGENSLGIRNDLPNNPNRAVVASPKDPIPPISGQVASREVFTATPPPTPTPHPTAIPTPKPTEIQKPVEKKVSLSKKPEELYRALLTNPISSDILPQGMSLRGTSASEIDATGKALKQVGAVTIKIEDPVSIGVNSGLKGIPNGGISYAIFPDSSGAKSASEVIGTHLKNEQVLNGFPYPTKIYTIDSFFGVITRILITSVENVTVITTFTGTDANLLQSRTISLGHAAIEHLKKAGR